MVSANIGREVRKSFEEGRAVYKGFVSKSITTVDKGRYFSWEVLGPSVEHLPEINLTCEAWGFGCF